MKSWIVLICFAMESAFAVVGDPSAGKIYSVDVPLKLLQTKDANSALLEVGPDQQLVLGADEGENFAQAGLINSNGQI